MKERLFALQDLAYRDFNAKLIPNIPSDSVIGVRVPQLRALAKTMTLDELGSLPHTYFTSSVYPPLVAEYTASIIAPLYFITTPAVSLAAVLVFSASAETPL